MAYKYERGPGYNGPMPDDDPMATLPQNTGMGYRGPGAMYAMGGPSPPSMGSAITGVASGQMPGLPGVEMGNEAHGPFDQIGGAVSGAAGKVGDFFGDIWGDMGGMEKAWLLSQVIGTGADIFSQYKQGKIEDEERERRDRAARAAQPYLRDYLGS